jgi:DNA ligase 1
MNIKPLLAVTCEYPEGLPYPVLASPKLDGIRCLIVDDVDGNPSAVSRSMKPIQNDFIRNWLEHNVSSGFDGEIMVIDDKGQALPFNEISSAVMRKDGEPNFQYWVFDFAGDCVDGAFGAARKCQFQERIKECQFREEMEMHPERIKLVEHVRINNEAELDEYEASCLSLGFEGVMVRRRDGIYKLGRSTEKEAILLKIKRFSQEEAYVVGRYEEERNDNVAVRNAVGQLERSSHKANKVGKATLGGFVGKLIKHGPVTDADRKWFRDNYHRLDAATSTHPIYFRCGSGFTAKQRREEWNDTFGQIFTLKHQASGALLKPRFPVFIGFRHQDDL